MAATYLDRTLWEFLEGDRKLFVKQAKCASEYRIDKFNRTREANISSLMPLKPTSQNETGSFKSQSTT